MSRHGRGYDVSLGYFHHDNDYWSMSYQKRCNGTILTDLWRKGPDAAAAGKGAVGYNNTCAGMFGPGPRPPGCAPGPLGDTWYGGYEDALLEQHVLATVQRHDTAVPLFVFWAPHGIHAPLQAPEASPQQHLNPAGAAAGAAFFWGGGGVCLVSLASPHVRPPHAGTRQRAAG